MADEKTNPTPKVAARDTMHSNPNTPDRRGQARTHEDRVADRDAESTAPPNVSVGSEKPGKRTIKTEKSGTLVEDLPGYEEPKSEEALNPGNPAPEEPVGVQPTESAATTQTRKGFDDKGRQKSERKS